jgi:hypothetical protein
MARPTFGTIVTDMQGSIGGNTFRKSRFGTIMYPKWVPTNNPTEEQSRVRAILGGSNAAFEALDADQKAAWGTYAANSPMYTKNGALYTPSAREAFIKFYLIASMAGITPIENGPTAFGLPSDPGNIVASASADTQKLSIAFHPADEPFGETGGYLLVYCSMPQSASKQTLQGPMVFAGKIAGNGTTPLTSPNTTIDIPFAAAEGHGLFLDLRVMRADGRISEPFRQATVVGA